MLVLICFQELTELHHENVVALLDCKVGVIPLLLLFLMQLRKGRYKVNLFLRSSEILKYPQCSLKI